MFPLKKIAALAASLVAAVSIVSLSPHVSAQGQGQGQGQASAADPALFVVEDATLDWIEKSSIAALREGVIEKMELQVGMPVARGGEIGRLRSEMAKLAVKKAQVAADRTGPTAKAAAQKELAAAVVAINLRLNERMRGAVSYEEVKKAEAELKVAHAMTVEAAEQLLSDAVELELAKQALEEHKILAPFDGIIIERMKHPGEKVGQNEAVVQLANLDRLKAFAYVPLEYAYRVKEGQIVELQIRLAGTRANPQPIEAKKFRGKITFVDPTIQPVSETAVRIFAEFDNRDHEIKPGLKGTLTIYLGTEAAQPAAPPAVGARDLGR